MILIQSPFVKDNLEINFVFASGFLVKELLSPSIFHSPLGPIFIISASNMESLPLVIAYIGGNTSVHPCSKNGFSSVKLGYFSLFSSINSLILDGLLSLFLRLIKLNLPVSRYISLRRLPS